MKTKYSFYRMIFAVVIATALGTTACTLQIQEENSGDSAVILSPSDGASYPTNTLIDVQVKIITVGTAQDVELFVNGARHSSYLYGTPFHNITAYLPWQPDTPGSYQIYVYVTSEKSNFSSNTITVDIQDIPNLTPDTPEPQNIIITPTPEKTTLTPTGEKEPEVTGKQVVNCRYGPSYAYHTLDGLQTGQTAQVIGINQDRSWVQLVGPNDHYINCWVPLDYVTLEGSLDGIAVIHGPLPVTETPDPGDPTKQAPTPSITSGPTTP